MAWTDCVSAIGNWRNPKLTEYESTLDQALRTSDLRSVGMGRRFCGASAAWLGRSRISQFGQPRTPRRSKVVAQ